MATIAGRKRGLFALVTAFREKPRKFFLRWSNMSSHERNCDYGSSSQVPGLSVLPMISVHPRLVSLPGTYGRPCDGGSLMERLRVLAARHFPR
jgi:hypothetical protein